MKENAPTTTEDSNKTRNGIIAGIGCYILWGFFPLYFKLLSEVNPLEITAHRIIWCFVFVILICLVTKTEFVSLLKSPRARKYLIPASILITLNYGIYIVAVSIDHIVEVSVGYYINPLVSVLLGVIVFKERLTKVQVVAVGLCVIGIVYFTINYGSFPWIAVAMSITFGIYGAVKKKGGYPAVQAIAVENTVMLIPAILFCVVLAFITGSHGFLGDTITLHGWYITGLLVIGGCITAIPLLLFATAANDIPLSVLGFIQYLCPTIALFIGVFVNGEPFTLAHAVCFACIWTALVLITGEALRNNMKNKKK